MSLRIIQSDPAGQDKEVILEIDPVGSGTSGVQTYQVSGKVVDYRGAAVEGVTVRAYHKGLTGTEIQLGIDAQSSTSGDYIIYYTTDLLPTGRNFADLQVRAYDVSENLLYQSPLITNALPVQEVNLSISSGEEFVGLSEYDRVKAAIDPLLTGLQLDQLTIEGIGIIASQTNFQATTVTDYVKALILNGISSPIDYSTISDEVYYGLFRYGLPYDKIKLVESPSSLITEGLEAVTSSNIINPEIKDDIASIIAAFLLLKGQTFLIDPVAVDGNSYIAKILTIAGITDTGERESFVGGYLDYGSDEDFWNLILVVFADEAGFTAVQKRDNVKAAFQIGVISQEYPLIVELVFASKSTGTPRIFGNIEEIGELTPGDWQGHITTLLTSSSGVDGVPNIESPTTLEQNSYVEALMTASEKAFPTEVLRTYMLADGGATGTYPDTYTFLLNNPSFDINSSSPRNFFDSMTTAPTQPIQDEILKIKRLWHLSDGYDKLTTIKLLDSLSLHSATQISNIGKRAFVKKYTGDFGTAEEAERIFKVAVKRSSAAAKLQAEYNPTVNTVNTGVFNDSSITASDVSANPNLDVLFGSEDYCQCKHCRSSFSPAAYLIDLLTFLKQTQVYDDSNNPTASNAWDIFKLRRPEFEKIELSCDNTNVTLPYIDLVNEVLENQVLQLNSQTQNLLRQTTLDVDTLRLRPEHLSKEAYDSLSALSSVYPWILPFHLWNEEGAGYLKLVDLNRADIIDALQGNNVFDNNSSKVYVKMSSALFAALGDTAFTPHYDDKITSTLQNVQNLLDITGVEFDELNLLLETNYVNPNGDVITFAGESCDLATANLTFTTANSLSYKHLHKFVRLQKLLGWAIPELDSALSAFGVDNFSDNEIVEIAGVQKVAHKLRLPVLDVVTFYADLSEISYNDKPSQYDEIYLNPRYNSDDTVRALFAAGTSIPLKVSGQLDNQYAPVVAAALRMKGADLLLLIENEFTDGTNPAKSVNKSELAHLYRVSVFIRALKLSVQDYLDYKAIINASTDPVSSVGTVVTPNGTLAWLDLFDSTRNTPFKLNDLRVLFLHDRLSIKKMDSASMDIFLNTVRSKIQTRLSEKSISTSRTREDVLNLFLIFLNEEQAVRSLEIVDKVESGTITEANTFIDTYWTDLVLNKTLVKSSLTASGGSITDDQLRRDFIFEQLNQSLITALLIDDVVSQSIADHTSYSRDHVTKLVYDELAINGYFTSAEFMHSTGDLSTLTDYTALYESSLRLLKILFVFDSLSVESRHIPLLMNSSVTTGWYDLTTLPITLQSSAANFDGFIRLNQAYQLERRYRVLDEFSIIDLIEAGSADYPALSEGTGWDINDINFLVANGMAYATNEGWLVKIQKVMDVLDSLGMSAEQAAQYQTVDLTYELSQALRAGIKANFSEDTWQKIAVEVRDKLRIQQRDALAAYLIANSSNPDPEFEDLTSLYEYFLMDVEMAPCMQTSRIKLALSSIQLWVQRIRMDLEPGIRFGQEELDEWEWRKNYRVWEAARKVFLYPENWLEPELRDDKSPFFIDMEDELLQDEVTMESAERAYLNYLTKLDDVAVLEISGIYREEDLNILHVFARTKNSPHIYYYRRQEDGFRWTAWEKIEVDIEGEHLIPVVFNRRPMIFWPIFSEAPKKVEDSELSVSTSATQVNGKNPVMYAEVKIAYTEWKNKKWQSKKVSKTKIYSTFANTPANYFFKVDTSTGELRIDAFYHADKSLAFSHLGGFVLNNCSADLEVDTEKTTVAPATFSVKNAFRKYMKILEEKENDSFTITERINFKLLYILQSDNLLSAMERVILKKTPGQFKITYPVSGVDLLSEVPFFFEDKNRVFFVQPSEEEFEKEIFLNLPLKLIKLHRDKVLPTKQAEPVDDSNKNIQQDGDYTYTPPTGGGGSGGSATLADSDDDLLKETVKQIQFIQ